VRGSALRIGLLTAAGALVIPVLVPVSSGLFKGGHGPGNGSASDNAVILRNPIVDLRRDLISQDHIPLVTARTTGDPTYLRLTVLDRFNGVEWLPSARRLPKSNQVHGDLPRAPGLAPDATGTDTDWSLELDDAFDTTWLPTPYPTRRIAVTRGDWRYDLRTLDIASVDKPDTGGLRYDLTGFTPDLSTSKMQQALKAPPDIQAPMTSVPGNRPTVITRTAQQVTAGATTDYDRMVMLQNWFRNTGGFSYSLAPAAGSGIAQLARFITTDKVGYCEQFAAAMAVMARSLGIPARVVVGFLAPHQLPDGSYSYTSDDLHAWPEIYFSGTGWVRFEPTPASRTGQPPPWTVGVAAPAPSAGPSATTAPSAKPTEKTQGAVRKSSKDTGSAHAVTLAAWTVAVVLVALLLALPGLVRARQRRRRLDDHRRGPRSHDASVLADGAWAELLATARDLGISLPLHRSVRDITAALRRRALSGAAVHDQLDALTEFIERAWYGRPFAVDAPTRQAVVEAVEAWSTVLADSVPVTRVRLARLFPRSVLDRATAPAQADRQLDLVGIEG
jgi:hypothetical protein